MVERRAFAIALRVTFLVGVLSQAGEAALAEEVPFVGPRIEALVGYDATELPDEDGPEVMFGIRGGKDFPLGKWRLGIEADISRSNANKVERDLFAPNDRIHVQYGTDLYAGVRQGRVLGRHVLAYGMAGGALTRMKVDYSGDLAAVEGKPGGPRPDKFLRPGTLVGFWTGAGIEFTLGKRTFVRTEYRYSNFHDGLYRHQAILGVGMRL
jgi:outer membrane immunogenic protein